MRLSRVLAGRPVLRWMIYPAVVLTLVFCLGPLVSREYTWVQDADGYQMTAPIEYTVRVRVAGDTAVTMAVLVRDVVGAEWSYVRRYSTANTAFPCRVFDEDNWDCWVTTASGGEDGEMMRMASGKLAWNYYGPPERQMRTRYRVLGVRLP